MDNNQQPTAIAKSFPVGPLGCNCTILGDPITSEALLIDPGGDAQKIMAELEDMKLKVKSIIHTHAHLDHFLASAEIHELTGAPLYLNQDDMPLWSTAEMQCQMMGLPYQPLPDPHHWLKDDDDLGCCSGVAMHTPGHTPGSMSFLFEDHKVLIAGDTLFKGSVGRTDLPGGDSNLIQKSIQTRIYTLDDDITVVTGHGPATSIGYEKRHNMFVRG